MGSRLSGRCRSHPALTNGGPMSTGIRQRTSERMLLALVAASFILAHTGCGSRLQKDVSGPPAKVLVVAVESMGWERLDHLLAKGELPHLGRLVREGTRATVVAPDPLDSSMLWTTAYTGKAPRVHRIAGDLFNLPNGTRGLMPSSMRPTKSLMQIAGEQGRTVLSVGIPVTWPAEVVNGHVVAPGATPERRTLTVEHTSTRDPREMAAYPPSLLDEISPLLRDPHRIRREEVSRFFTLNELEYGMLYDEPLGSVFERTNPLRDFGVTYQRDLSYVDVTLALMKRYHSRLITVHLELLEALQPIYWPFAYPDYFRTPADSRRRFGHTVDAGHRFVDEQIGRLLAGLPPGSTVAVVSQHGFGNSATDSDEGPRMEAVPTNEGVLILWGQGISAGQDLGRVQLTDLTPTVLALLGLPVGADMDGDVLTKAMHPEFAAAHARSAVESHDAGWDPNKRYPQEFLRRPHSENRP
jgi:hypothetical protein